MQTLDEIAMQLSDKHIFPGVLAFAQHAIQQAADADARVGACVALSAIAEGCCDTVAARIQEVLQVGQKIFLKSLNQTTLSLEVDP